MKLYHSKTQLNGIADEIRSNWGEYGYNLYYNSEDDEYGVAQQGDGYDTQVFDEITDPASWGDEVECPTKKTILAILADWFRDWECEDYGY